MEGRIITLTPRPEDSDAKRIGDELRGLDAGTDPFVAAVRATRMPMIITDPRLPDNPLVFANEAFCRLTGYSRAEILGRNCRFLQGPETDRATVAAIRRAVERGESIEADIRNYRKNGETFWNRLLLAPVQDLSGQLAYFFASQMDVTLERERLSGLEQANAALTAEVGDRINEATLSRRREQALIALDSQLADMESPSAIAHAAARILGETLGTSRAGYGTVHLDSETIVIADDWMVPGLSSISGTLSFREYGSYIEDLKAGDTVVVTDTRADQRTQPTSARLEDIQARAFINMPLGENAGLAALCFLTCAEPRPWQATELDFVRTVAQRTYTVIERRRAQAALKALAASLEDQVQARTQALLASEAQLRHSQKMKAVGQLTGGIAHDFNNLLQAIGSSLELLRVKLDRGDTTDSGRLIGIALGGARRAAALTHRLLAFSRLQTLEPQRTDINRLVGGMGDLISRTVGPAITVTTTLASELWPCAVDRGQLETALLNLCINARDAMPDGGQLTIATANQELQAPRAVAFDLEPGAYVSLCVSDNGVGMAEEIVSKAFDPFFTTKPLGEGTGLGLSMVYGFARQSGGQARIHSKPGIGTSVCIYFPRHAAAGDAERAEPDAAQAAPPTRSGLGQTLLLVEDEAPIRELLATCAREAGYRVLEAHDGASALVLLNERPDQPVDLIVTDVGLPGGMNGRQFAGRARALRPTVRILFVTGYAESVISAESLGPRMHLMVKPFELGAFLARVAELLDGARDAAAPESP